MKNGTQSRKLRLVESSDRPADGASENAHTATQYDATPDPNGVSPVLILLTVSIACATAAVAAGSYALWLARQKATRQTLMDVQDILRVCQERMHKMEDDLIRLPGSLDPTTA